MKKMLLVASMLSLTGISCVSQQDFISLQNQMANLQQEVNELKSKHQNLEQKTENLAQRIDEVSNIAAKNSIEIQKLKLGYKPPENPPVEGQEQVKNASVNPEDIYNQALDLYYQGKLDEAEAKFKEFAEKYKNNHLYDNALFWIGQIYYTKGEYQKAIEVFQDLINKCESGEIKECNKLSDALLKIAYSYLKINNNEKAKFYFQKIVEKYPDSDEAEIAKRKLEALQ
jgi:tol-pal system protein YbgF